LLGIIPTVGATDIGPAIERVLAVAIEHKPVNKTTATDDYWPPSVLGQGKVREEGEERNDGNAKTIHQPMTYLHAEKFNAAG